MSKGKATGVAATKRRTVETKKSKRHLRCVLTQDELLSASKMQKELIKHEAPGVEVPADPAKA